MGQNARKREHRDSYITVDWLVLLVTCAALVLLLATTLRTPVEGDPEGRDGFRELAAHETLLAYQDFTFGAPGWRPDATSDRLPGLGPVLGPFDAEPVQRSFPIPADADHVRLSFDLHLIGDWAEQGGLTASLNETELLRVQMPEGTTSAAEVEATQSASLSASAHAERLIPRQPEDALPGSAPEITILRVRIEMSDPPETLTLRLDAQVDGAAQWTLDNLTAVAARNDGVAMP
ncbi:hypothetical protein [Gymnodinialimonas ceratoperidinii]|uniref:Uncharacterized protein n=1 Tax=Gymnodinialimonas ceratoperidinii TaxID=2856823 RepID=A0A8F6YBH9_9RHOB|nr:hypothetical protein [Gymnodinialimonas ceratoperidinii]QXT40116.1 hypothetical protein KYE46_02330 [Gymnodinialimonas ceratoperidinii]